mmetsp:Transcript_580/g.1484  ORF Transcript_580/g.1484 Transcript_580/m.1484 type:complete len:87 (-) Transcript_580:46-306(-)
MHTPSQLTVNTVLVVCWTSDGKDSALRLAMLVVVIDTLSLCSAWMFLLPFVNTFHLSFYFLLMTAVSKQNFHRSEGKTMDFWCTYN